MKPVFYDCGICGHFHPWSWDGDCREDKSRFTYADLDRIYGAGDYEIRSMEERVTADLKE